MKFIFWLFGIIVFGIGLLNTFWGNDSGYGIFLLALSFIYFPPAANFITEKIGFKIPYWVKIIIGIFILWSAFGVADLFDKIDLMINDLS